MEIILWRIKIAKNNVKVKDTSVADSITNYGNNVTTRVQVTILQKTMGVLVKSKLESEEYVRNKSEGRFFFRTVIKFVE